MSEIRVDRIKDEAGTGAVELSNGATVPSGKTLTVSGTLTYEDVTSVDSIGIVTARGGLEVGAAGVGGTVSSTGNVEFTGFTTIPKLSGTTEMVSVASTASITAGKEVILELDCSKGTVFSHDLEADGSVGIVSIKNFRVDANSFTTATVIFTQRSSTPTGGVGNTLPTALSGNPGGIGTNITLKPAGVTGFTTTAKVATASTITLATTGADEDIVTISVHYNGGGTGTPGNYKVYATNNTGYRYGSIGF